MRIGYSLTNLSFVIVTEISNWVEAIFLQIKIICIYFVKQYLFLKKKNFSKNKLRENTFSKGSFVFLYVKKVHSICTTARVGRTVSLACAKF